MNREIKFRGLNSKNGQWEYGNYCGIHSVDYIMYAGIQSFEYKLVNSESIGQFTGLLDKNGKEIYEGDIINLHIFGFDGNETEHEYIGVININDFGVQFDYHKDDQISGLLAMYNLHDESLEVLGNIHQHPELLK